MAKKASTPWPSPQAATPQTATLGGPPGSEFPPGWSIDPAGGSPAKGDSGWVNSALFVLYSLGMVLIGLGIGLLSDDSRSVARGRQAGEELVRNEAIAAGAGRWYHRCGIRWWAWMRPDDDYFIIDWVQPDGHVVPRILGRRWDVCAVLSGPYRPLIGFPNEQPTIDHDGYVSVGGNVIGIVERQGDGTWRATGATLWLDGPRIAILPRELDAVWWLARRYDRRAPQPKPKLPKPGPQPANLTKQRDA